MDQLQFPLYSEVVNLEFGGLMKKYMLAAIFALHPLCAFGSGFVSCDLYYRQSDTSGRYTNVKETKGLKSSQLDDEITDGIDLGLEGSFEMKDGDILISGGVRENVFESVGISEKKSEASAYAMPFRKFVIIQLTTQRGAFLFEAQCRVEQN
jgi:hypothetical protein